MIMGKWLLVQGVASPKPPRPPLPPACGQPNP